MQWKEPTFPAPFAMRHSPDEKQRLIALVVGSHGGGPVRSYENDELACIVSHDQGAMHASLSHRERYPTWDEIKAIREWVFPNDVEVVMVLPRAEDYVNLHPNCFHLWESACGKEGR